MCFWAMRVALRCEVLLELLHEENLSGPLVRIDETPLQVLNEPGRAPTTKSYMWVFVGGAVDKPAVVYLYHPTRAGNVPLQYLKGYQGYIQTDGYTAYDELGRQPGIRMLGCMAHARRKFFDVTKAAKNAKSALEALSRIKKLYAIEHEAKDRELKASQIKQLRQEKSVPILDALKEWLDNKVAQVPPKSLLGKAVGYSLGQWDRLTRYVEDGILTPDNNVAENCIHPFVVGRKNWLFNYHSQGAAASAALYSLIETAKANKLEPYFYLRYLFDRLPLLDGNRGELKKLLPQYVDKADVRNQDFYAPKPPLMGEVVNQPLTLIGNWPCARQPQGTSPGSWTGLCQSHSVAQTKITWSVPIMRHLQKQAYATTPLGLFAATLISKYCAHSWWSSMQE